MDSPWHSDPAKCPSPRDGIGLLAASHGQRTRIPQAVSDDLAKFLFEIDRKLWHSSPTIRDLQPEDKDRKDRVGSGRIGCDCNCQAFAVLGSRFAPLLS